MPRPRNAERPAKEAAAQIPAETGRLKTRRRTIPGPWLLEILRASGSDVCEQKIPADARIVGTGWDRVFNENQKPFAQAIFLSIESVEFESGEEANV